MDARAHTPPSPHWQTMFPQSLICTSVVLAIYFLDKPKQLTGECPLVRYECQRGKRADGKSRSRGEEYKNKDKNTLLSSPSRSHGPTGGCAIQGTTGVCTRSVQKTITSILPQMSSEACKASRAANSTSSPTGGRAVSGREHVQEEEEVEIKEHVHVLSWETGGFLCPKGTEQDQLPNLKPELSPTPPQTHVVEEKKELSYRVSSA